MTQKPESMKAVAIDHFGGPEVLTMHTLPVPEIGPDEVLIQIEAAGVGVWDPMEREGAFNEMMGIEPHFPHVPGSDGAGTVVAVGEQVTRFKEGDRVYAGGLMNPKGGFYAEYVVVQAEHAAFVPQKLSFEQAGAMPADAITALRGLDEIIGLSEGESVMIFGASGGVGHLAVQIAKRMGARVLAVASGEDGVALARSLGADIAVDGHRDDIEAAIRAFAPDGLDAALVTASSPDLGRILALVRDGGRVAYPNGVQPEPQARPEVQVRSYDGESSQERLNRLNQLIESGPFEVHIDRTFSLEEAAEAHRALSSHFLGKLALRTH